MKLYPPHRTENGSMVPHDSYATLLYQLQEWFSPGPPTIHVLETGTYHGTGTTRALLNAIMLAGRHASSFVTIEADPQNWAIARRNLGDEARCILGCSVSVQRALAQMNEDPFLEGVGVDLYSDVPDGEDPVAFYRRELEGQLFSQTDIRPDEYAGEMLLEKCLYGIRDQTPLIALDSAGGIGWYEYRLVREIMGERRFALLIDDVRHIKHYRSLEHMIRDERCEIRHVSRGAHAWAFGVFT